MAQLDLLNGLHKGVRVATACNTVGNPKYISQHSAAAAQVVQFCHI